MTVVTGISNYMVTMINSYRRTIQTNTKYYVLSY